jgi:hypothetical protein
MCRVLFLGEGSSDDGITAHIERIAGECGLTIAMTAPDMGLLPLDDRSVLGKLEAIKKIGGEYDLLVIHRDRDNSTREARVAEIMAAVGAAMPETLCVPVIPVRMTEAWLVLDEKLIRMVAGNPNGRVPLPMPDPGKAERIADPKDLLKELLVTASELTGRKRRIFQSRFPYHRKQVLERLDPYGTVRYLESWRAFDSDLRAMFETLRRRRDGMVQGTPADQTG